MPQPIRADSHLDEKSHQDHINKKSEKSGKAIESSESFQDGPAGRTRETRARTRELLPKISTPDHLGDITFRCDRAKDINFGINLFDQAKTIIDIGQSFTTEARWKPDMQLKQWAATQMLPGEQWTVHATKNSESAPVFSSISFNSSSTGYVKAGSTRRADVLEKLYADAHGSNAFLNNPPETFEMAVRAEPVTHCTSENLKGEALHPERSREFFQHVSDTAMRLFGERAPGLYPADLK